MKSYIFFALFLILWALFSTGFDLGADEAHYVLYARNLDWSYFDHPPLVGWIHFIFQTLLGHSNISARLPSLLLWGWFYLELKKSKLLPKISDFLYFQFLLVPFMLSLFLLPDTPIVPISLTLIRVCKQITGGASLINWIKLGLLLGLAGLSKYSAILLVLPIGLYLLYHFKWRLFNDLRFYLSVTIALILILPVIYWNFQNDFISFKYQIDHVMGQSKGLENFLKSSFMQWLGYGVILTPILFIQTIKNLPPLYREWKNKKQIPPLTFLFGIIWTLFFLYSSFSEVTLPHWTLIGWIFLFLHHCSSISLKWLKIQNVISLIVLFVLSLILWFPVSFHHAINLKEVRGWPQLMNWVADKVEDDEVLYITNWSYGSRANLYAPPKLQNRIRIADLRADQFDIWEKKQDLQKFRSGKLIVFKDDSFNFPEFPVSCQLYIPDAKVEDELFQKWKHEFNLYHCAGKP